MHYSPLKRVVLLGAVSWAVVGSVYADTQKAETTIFTDDDAKPFTKAFEPILEVEAGRIDAAKPDPEHPDRMNVPRIQLQRLCSGDYRALLVKFATQRDGQAATASTAFAPGVLPTGEKDLVTVATCGALGTSGYFANVETTYSREKGQWVMESHRYHQVGKCVAASGLLDDRG